MKKILLYLLLFCYTITVCKPLFPTIVDTIAHIFWYSEHIATVHYEHGKYHVHYEYQQAEKNNYPSKDTLLLKADFASDHINSTGAVSFQPATVVSIHYHSLSAAYIPLIYLHSDFPPPKC